MDTPGHPTLGELLRDAERRLTGRVESPRADAEILAQHSLGVTRTMLRAFPERGADPKSVAVFESAIDRRAAGEPVAYVIGEREFWSLRFKVTPATLIPRPETETLVEVALELIPDGAPLRIADLGTGSGAIALAIAHERPHCHIIATDARDAALTVARENAVALKINNVEFRVGDWTKPLQDERFDLIVSNPPYIAANDDHLRRGDVVFEPSTALVAGDDGLSDIRRIVADVGQRLKPGGWLAIEHGWDQSAAVCALFQHNGYGGVRSIADLAGIARVSIGQFGTSKATA